jgi:hypothetical protein
MNASPSRSPLYRIARWFVICGALFVSCASAQVSRAPAVRKEPRALGLLELAPDGKAHLIPIAILVDGQYFDAGAYKAAPVPMALWSDTVYEAIQTGVSQGLFTVTGALQRKETNEWIGEGKWQSASSLAAAAKAPKKAESSEPRGMNVDEGPPVLRRSGAEKPKPPEAPAAGQSAPAASPTAAPAPSTPASGGAATTSAPANSASAGSSPSTAPASAPAATTHAADQAATGPAISPGDKDAPVLKRGKPSPASKRERDDLEATPPKAVGHSQQVPAAKPSTSAVTVSAPSPISPAATAVQLIPAISDSSGPDLRPYAYSMKPDEELAFRKKMLALAADEVRARAGQLAHGPSNSASASSSSSQGKARAAKPIQPNFDDVQLRAFDLSNVNEPELVLTANARMPQRPTARDSGGADLQFMVTLVAREDVNGVLHKALANVTDTQHLDVLPRLELIDAVDVDGDGRGELLFRQASDAGSAFVVYRVIGDRLYPLFQGSHG